MKYSEHSPCILWISFELFELLQCTWSEGLVLKASQSPIRSDQVLLDIVHVVGVMFNVKYIYLKIVDVTQDF